MAKPVPSNDSYEGAFQTPLIVGLEQDFNQQGSAAEVNAVGFAPEFTGDPFVERGTLASVLPVGFAGSFQIGQIFFGARAEVLPEGKSGSLQTAQDDGLLTTLPTWDDEQAAYALRGIDDSSAALDVEDMGWSSGQRANFEGWDGSDDLHNDTEGDDFWLAFWQVLRLQAARPDAAVTWGDRLASITPFYRDNYADEVDQPTEQNFDHLYGWGLCDHITQNPGDTVALDTVNAVVAKLIAWNANDFVVNPGDLAVGDAGNGSRRWSRNLRFAVRAHEVSPLSSHLTWRNKVIDIVLQEPEWVEADGYGIFSKNASTVDATIGAGSYAAGWRAMNTYHMGIMFDALWNAWRVLYAEGDPRATTVMNRIIGMAKFYRDIPLNANGFLELFCAYNISTQAWHMSDGEGSPIGSGTYSTSPINGLIFALKFTKDTTFRERAWLLWTNRQKGQSGSSTLLDHYSDSRSASGDSHTVMAYNKGELQYNYALFENGGNYISVPGYLPSWYPEWQDPGVIKTIPNSTFEAAIAANGWTDTPDPVAGGTGWPRGLYAFSGGAVGYINGQPYLCMCGGGHATTSDNRIFAFGPLAGAGSDTPVWSALYGPIDSSAFNGYDLQGGDQHYANGQPSSRHTVGDFSYGLGRFVMLWNNSPYAADGGTGSGTDVYDIERGTWDNEEGIVHPDSGMPSQTHSMGCFHPHDGLFYARGRTATGFGRYDVFAKQWEIISGADITNSNDTMLITMGPRDFLYYWNSATDNYGRINTQTGQGELGWGLNPPGGNQCGVVYDTHQDRIYIPNPGRFADNQNLPNGSKQVAFIPADATSNPTFQYVTFNGDTPHQMTGSGGFSGIFGRCSYVPELKGFVMHPAYDSPVFFYRTAE